MTDEETQELDDELTDDVGDSRGLDVPQGVALTDCDRVTAAVSDGVAHAIGDALPSIECVGALDAELHSVARLDADNVAVTLSDSLHALLTLAAALTREERLGASLAPDVALALGVGDGKPTFEDDGVAHSLGCSDAEAATDSVELPLGVALTELLVLNELLALTESDAHGLGEAAGDTLVDCDRVAAEDRDKERRAVDDAAAEPERDAVAQWLGVLLPRVVRDSENVAERDDEGEGDAETDPDALNEADEDAEELTEALGVIDGSSVALGLPLSVGVAVGNFDAEDASDRVRSCDADNVTLPGGEADGESEPVAHALGASVADNDIDTVTLTLGEALFELQGLWELLALDDPDAGALCDGETVALNEGDGSAEDVCDKERRAAADAVTVSVSDEVEHLLRSALALEHCVGDTDGDPHDDGETEMDAEADTDAVIDAVLLGLNNGLTDRVADTLALDDPHVVAVSEED